MLEASCDIFTQNISPGHRLKTKLHEKPARNLSMDICVSVDIYVDVRASQIKKNMIKKNPEMVTLV